MCAWALPDNLLPSRKAFVSSRLFPNGVTLRLCLGESDPEGCAACSARDNPQNSYRNGPLYAAYTAEVLQRIYALATSEHINFLGAVTWAFEFENQPPFEGFRELATNGIDKPVLNAFRMFGLLGTERLKATSSGSLPTEGCSTRWSAGAARRQCDWNSK